MAVVHLGQELVEGRPPRLVAIKRLHPHLIDEGEFVSMLLDEARLTTRLRHPNIVSTLDVVFAGRELFLVMDYIEGETLGTVKKVARHQGKAFPIAVTAAIVRDALLGLHAAHEATGPKGEPLGVVHRDFSPGNVMIGVNGATRVLDFGVAKAEGRLTSTRNGTLKGKLAYMAPEQLLGEQVDRRADIFAVGLVLWEMLTDKRAYTGGDNDAALVAKVIAADFEAPSQTRPEVSGALDEVVLRALKPRPDDRFASALAMAEALSACVAIASPEEVARFLTETAPDGLKRRADAVSAMDGAVSGIHPRGPLASVGEGTAPGITSLGSWPSDQSSSGLVTFDRPDLPPSGTPNRNRRKLLWALPIPIVAALAVALGLATRTDASATVVAPTANSASSAGAAASAAASASASAAPATSTVAAAAPAPSSEASLPPVASTAPAADVPSGPAKTSPPGSGRSTIPARPASGGKSGACKTSPYTKGADGILRIRPECLLPNSDSLRSTTSLLSKATSSISRF
jgi:serine/threonine-protein kinase